MIKQSSKRLFSMILSLAFLASAFIVYLDFIQPAYGELRTQKGVELGSRQFLENEKIVIGQAKKLISQFGEATQAGSHLALAMPSGPDVSGALAQIYGLAQNNNIQVKGVTISAPAIQLQQTARAGGASAAPILKPMGMLSFQVSGVGSYDSLKAFLGQLESNVRLFDVTAFSLQPTAQSSVGNKLIGGPNMFTYNFTVNTYYQLP